MKQQIEDLLAYHIWANREVCNYAESLTQAQFQQEHDYSTGSVAKQLFHLMQTDWFTPPTLKGGFPDPNSPEAPKEEDYPDVASLRAKWESLEADLREAVLALSEAEWLRPYTLSFGKDMSIDTNAWEMFVTSVNHGTNHRAQTLALIDQLGGKTGEQGYFFYLMQRS